MCASTCFMRSLTRAPRRKVDLAGAVLLLLPFMAVLAVVRLELRDALVEHSRALAGSERPAVRLSVQDADSVVRRAARAAGRVAGVPCRRGASPQTLVRAMLAETLAVLLVVAVCAALFAGYPVALTLAGVSLAFAVLGHLTGAMSFTILAALPQRIFGVMTNGTLLAIPMLIFMGVMLERSRIAEDLLETMGRLVRPPARRAGDRRGAGRHAAGGGQGRGRRHHRDDGADRAAGDAALRLRQETGGRNRRGHRDAGADFSAGHGSRVARRPARQCLSVSATRAGQFRPALGQCQRTCSPVRWCRPSRWSGCISSMSSASRFSSRKPRRRSSAIRKGRAVWPSRFKLMEVLVAPVALILAVLGSILGGIATPTEAASIGAVGAILLAARKTAIVPLAWPGRAEDRADHIDDLPDPDRRDDVQPGVSRASAATSWSSARCRACRAARRARSSS